MGGILFLMLIAVGCCPAGAGTSPDAGILHRIEVSDQVTEIVLRLNGVADIELVETENVFGVQDLTYSTTGQAPIRVETSGNRILLTQTFVPRPWTQWDRADAARYRLLLPAKRRLTIKAGNATLSGSVRATDMTISAANLSVQRLSAAIDNILEITGAIAHLDMRVSGCGQVKLHLGVVTGRLGVDEDTKVMNTSRTSTLRVLRRPDLPF